MKGHFKLVRKTHYSTNNAQTWRRKWQPTPAFLPGESYGQRGLVGSGPWGCKELDTTEQQTFNAQTNGKPAGEKLVKLNPWTVPYTKINSKDPNKKVTHTSTRKRDISKFVTSSAIKCRFINLTLKTFVCRYNTNLHAKCSAVQCECMLSHI